MRNQLSVLITDIGEFIPIIDSIFSALSNERKQIIIYILFRK